MRNLVVFHPIAIVVYIAVSQSQTISSSFECLSNLYSNDGPISPAFNKIIGYLNITSSMRISMDIIINSFPSNTWSQSGE